MKAQTYSEFKTLYSQLQAQSILSAELDEPLECTHPELAKLRRIEAALQVLLPILQDTVELCKGLRAFNDALWLPQDDDSSHRGKYLLVDESLKNYMNRFEAYARSVTFLLEKNRATAQLLSDTLDVKYQMTTERIGQNTFALTKKTTGDSATVRVITVLTLIYLPVTSVAVSQAPNRFGVLFLCLFSLHNQTIFGMQFFSSDQNGHLVVAWSHFWIFFAFAAPLACLTLTYWKLTEKKAANNSLMIPEKRSNGSV